MNKIDNLRYLIDQKDWDSFRRQMSGLSPSQYIEEETGDSILSIAAHEGKITAVKEIFEFDIHVDHQNNFGQTALWLACNYEHPEIVELLLTHSADPNITDDQSQSPLHKAAAVDNVKAMNLLINSKADINWMDNHGRSAIVHSILAKAFRALSVLIKAEADLNYANFLGHTPLSYSILYYDKKIWDALIKNGASLNPKICNENMLEAAKNTGNEEVIKSVRDCISAKKKLS